MDRRDPRHRAGSLPFVTYVIGSECVDVMDKSCVQECPVDCIYEGARMLYINPDECVDCGACKPACRVEAIYWEGDLPDDQHQHLGDNAAFFHQVRAGPSGSAGFAGWCRSGGPDRSRHASGRGYPGGVPLVAGDEHTTPNAIRETAAGRPFQERSSTHHVRHWSPAATDFDGVPAP